MGLVRRCRISSSRGVVSVSLADTKDRMKEERFEIEIADSIRPNAASIYSCRSGMTNTSIRAYKVFPYAMPRIPHPPSSQPTGRAPPVRAKERESARNDKLTACIQR